MVPKQQKLSLKNRALRFLSLREHSRQELGRKLARFAEEGDDIDALLDFLEEKRFLSGERFTESLIRKRAENYGDQRILAELQTHGLDAQVIEQSKAELAETEVTRARAVWEKKFGRSLRLPNSGDKEEVVDNDTSRDAALRARAEQAKQVRYLMQRGFSSKAIKAVLQKKYDTVDDE